MVDEGNVTGPMPAPDLHLEAQQPARVRVSTVVAAAAAGLFMLACTRGPAEPELAGGDEQQSTHAALQPATSGEDAERERAARRAVQDARAFLRQGRPEAALRATTRGLAIRHDDAPLLRARARALDALGRHGKATASRTQADRIDPPPPPLPAGPRDGQFDDLLVVMQSPEVDLTSTRARRNAQAAPQLQRTLVARLERRLPGALIVFEAERSPESVPAARDWLMTTGRTRMAGLHLGRAFCGESIKDGRYAVASIERSQAGPEPIIGAVRWTGRPEAEAPGCVPRALERALETWLEDPFFDSIPSDGSDEDMTARLSRESVLLLLPDLRARIDAERVIARRALFVGDLDSARAAWQRMALLDPEDGDVHEHLAELDRTIALNRELAQLEAAQGRKAANDPTSASAGVLPARLTPAQQAALEHQLEAERRRRDDLLATLAAVTGDRRSVHVPVAALRSTELLDPTAKGPQRAWAQLQRDHEPGQTSTAAEPQAIDLERLAVRTLHSPGGSLIARYYFDRLALVAPDDEPSPSPLLVEEDASGNGQIDRWTSYAAGIRTETWEERRSEDLPDLHVIYAADGRTFVRVELDDPEETGQAGQINGGVPERTYSYVDGLLTHAAADTNGDGQLDYFDRFDAEGRVTLREEDLTGDGRIDVRTFYKEGRLMKREIMDPAAFDGSS